MVIAWPTGISQAILILDEPFTNLKETACLNTVVTLVSVVRDLRDTDVILRLDLRRPGQLIQLYETLRCYAKLLSDVIRSLLPAYLLIFGSGGVLLTFCLIRLRMGGSFQIYIALTLVEGLRISGCLW